MRSNRSRLGCFLAGTRLVDVTWLDIPAPVQLENPSTQPLRYRDGSSRVERGRAVGCS
jgi:hypothetical protein